MAERAPSRAALLAAAARLRSDRLPAPTGDPEADERLARDVVAGFEFEFETDAQIAGYLRVRTSFFDRVVVNALDRGTTQVTAIGPGYDGRALRYRRPGVRWFEVDQAVMQGDKRRRLERLAIPTPDITFVVADLARDDLAAVLVEAGFEPDAPSLLLCEGIATYLEPSVLGGMLAQLRSVATAGTRLAMSAGIPGATAADADVETLLATARWRTAELSDRARRTGMLVGLPVWEPGAPPTLSRTGAYLERTFHRSEIGSLAEHLARTYGITVTGTRLLDVGVVRVDRADGPAWVARIFPAARPLDVTHRDADILRFLATAEYPAERLADPDPVSEHDGQAVLVTRFVDGRAPRQTQATFRQLGELLGRLHTLPDAPTRPGGAWHHLTFEGGPDTEIAALRGLLDARSHVPDERREALATLRRQVAALDDLHDLPRTFTHADFVTANAIVVPTDTPVMIDWSGAGVAPRLWTLGFLLWSAGLSGPRHVDATVQGYRQHVALDATELDRLEPALAARPLIFEAWSYATGRRPLAEVLASQTQVNAKAIQVAERARAAFRRAG
jgi:methyltransferase (TIGR00027 family)